MHTLLVSFQILNPDFELTGFQLVITNMEGHCSTRDRVSTQNVRRGGERGLEVTFVDPNFATEHAGRGWWSSWARSGKGDWVDALQGDFGHPELAREKVVGWACFLSLILPQGTLEGVGSHLRI